MEHLDIDAPNDVISSEISQLIGVTIMQHRSSRMVRLGISGLHSWTEEKMNELVSSIAGGLRVNTTLESVRIDEYNNFVSVLPIATSLCDASSIESIVNSNHSLRMLHVDGAWNRAGHQERIHMDLINKYVTINGDREQSRNDIIRKKIVDFHMSTNFDVSQLKNLPLTAFTRLLAATSSKGNCQHATFWLFKNKPELSQVRARS